MSGVVVALLFVGTGATVCSFFVNLIATAASFSHTGRINIGKLAVMCEN